jgi:transposase
MVCLNFVFDCDCGQASRITSLTIGLDLGDRTSHYCILNEAGEVIWEQELPTTAKGSEQVFRKIPQSRIALETGTHSPWISWR